MWEGKKGKPAWDLNLDVFVMALLLCSLTLIMAGLLVYLQDNQSCQSLAEIEQWLNQTRKLFQSELKEVGKLSNEGGWGLSGSIFTA